MFSLISMDEQGYFIWLTLDETGQVPQYETLEAARAALDEFAKQVKPDAPKVVWPEGDEGYEVDGRLWTVAQVEGLSC